MLSAKPKNLAGSTSVFLDLLRLTCALLVFFVHARAIWFPEREADRISSDLSHGAVVIFFVLSGFVIAHTTISNNRGPRQYAVARLSRLYSIFFPAIVLSIICSLLISRIDPLLFSRYNRGGAFFRYTLSLFYSNEIWFLSAAPLINGPIWSLSYEFWYYLIFGVVFYKTPGWKGWLLAAVACLVAGPKILLMMFMWLAGWLVYQLPSPRMKSEYGWVALVVCFVLAIVVMLTMPAIPFTSYNSPFTWAWKFISDWVASIFVALGLWFLPKNHDTSASAAQASGAIYRKMADLTFPIYVMHMPILILTKACMGTKLPLVWQITAGWSVGLWVCCIIGLYLEKKRYWWNRFFSATLTKLGWEGIKG